MKLFLDDERRVSDVTWIQLPQGPWVIVRTVGKFVEWIEENGLPEFISFDHDLAEEHYPVHELNWEDYQKGLVDYSKYQEPTGLSAAKFLVKYCRERNLDIPPYTAHTMNVVGRMNIIAELQAYEHERRQG